MRDQDFKKHHFDSNSGQDFISNLPQALKDNILTRLNIIEAVRTCILSKRWRYAWCTMPKLVICTAYFNEIDKDRNIDCSKFINSLLSHHKGPITEFILSIENFYYEDLERWIHVLGNKGVKDVCFKFDLMDSCEIPSSLLSCLLGLTNLKFRSRTLDVPQLFNGFKLLRTLELDVATIDSTDFERLVSRCPLLQNLKLETISEIVGNLVIQSQSLKIITIVSNIKHLVFETPKLLMLGVVLTKSPLDHKIFKVVRGSYQTHPDRLLPDLHAFCVFFEACHIEATPRKLPIKFNHLIQMVVDMDVSTEDSLVAALCLFKSAPRLQDLHVKIYNTGGLGSDSNCDSFWESEASVALFNNLKTVIIQPSGPRAAQSIIAIVKFILRTASILEEMTIRDSRVVFMMHSMKTQSLLGCVSRNNRYTEYMEEAMATVLEVLKLPRLSKKATVGFEESNIFDPFEQCATSANSPA